MTSSIWAPTTLNIDANIPILVGTGAVPTNIGYVLNLNNLTRQDPYTADSFNLLEFVSGVFSPTRKLVEGVDYTITGAQEITFLLQLNAGTTNLTVIDYRLEIQEVVEIDVSTFKDFGAIGDGVADDTAAVLAALSDTTVRVIDGGGLTYRVVGNIASTNENLTVRDATFDISDLPSGVAFTFSGVESSATALTSDILKDSKTVTLGSTSAFTADSYAWLSSDAIFSNTQTVILGQVVKIKSIDSPTAITLYDDVLYNFTTADNAKIATLALLKDVAFENVKIIGANAGTQTCFKFDRCLNAKVSDCSFEYVDYVSVLFDRCVNSKIADTSMKYARTVGLAYGVVMVNGCYSCTVQNCHGEDLRHLVSVGDNDGVNLFIRVTACHSASSKDAGIDAHPACDFMIIDGNTVECIDGTADGIIFQGLNCVITDNIVVGNVVSSIRFQVTATIGSGSCIIANNRVVNSGGTPSSDTAINVTNDGFGADLTSVVISNNIIDGTLDTGIFLYARTGNIFGVAISNNVMISIASVVGCQLRAAATYLLQDFTITGNIFKCSGTQNLYLLGTTVPNVLDGTISGNTIKGGSNGIRTILAGNVVETGNYNTGTIRKVFVDTGSTNVVLDRRQSTIVTVAVAAYTVLHQDNFLIINRAGTTVLTLPAAADYPGRELRVKNIQAQALNSATSNVVPIEDSTAGTAILPATDGAWATLVSDGTNWIIVQKG